MKIKNGQGAPWGGEGATRRSQVAGQSMKYQQGEEREPTAEKDVRSQMVNRFNSLPLTRRRQ